MLCHCALPAGKIDIVELERWLNKPGKGMHFQKKTKAQVQAVEKAAAAAASGGGGLGRRKSTKKSLKARPNLPPAGAAESVEPAAAPDAAAASSLLTTDPTGLAASERLTRKQHVWTPRTTARLALNYEEFKSTPLYTASMIKYTHHWPPGKGKKQPHSSSSSSHQAPTTDIHTPLSPLPSTTGHPLSEVPLPLTLRDPLPPAAEQAQLQAAYSSQPPVIIYQQPPEYPRRKPRKSKWEVPTSLPPLAPLPRICSDRPEARWHSEQRIDFSPRLLRDKPASHQPLWYKFFAENRARDVQGPNPGGSLSARERLGVHYALRNRTGWLELG